MSRLRSANQVNFPVLLSNLIDLYGVWPIAEGTIGEQQIEIYRRPKLVFSALERVVAAESVSF